MKRLIVVAIVGVALTFAACSSGPTHGFVIAKQYTPGHYYLYENPIPHTTCEDELIGKTMEDECSTTYTYVPEELWAGPEWQLELRSDGAKGWVTVSQKTYDRTHKGDYYGQAK
jgi:hypothetical protein